MITIDQEFGILEEFGFSIEAIIVQATTKVIYNHFWCCKSQKKYKSSVFRSYIKKLYNEDQQKVCLISIYEYSTAQKWNDSIETYPQ